MQRIWLRPVRPSTGACELYVSVVREVGQAETVAKHPASEHQHGDGARPLARPIQIPRPFQSAPKASHAPIPRPTPQ